MRPGLQGKWLGIAGQEVQAYGQQRTRTPSCSTAWHTAGQSFRRFQVTAGLILACSENPACFVFFFFSFFFFLFARGLLNFQFLAVPIPGRHISVLIPTRAKIDSVTKNKSQLPDEANVIHPETNPETNERWNTRRLVCIHGTGFGLCVHSVVRNIYTE